jgi:ABC-type Na+ transport system ATPase subunit NatA
VFKALDDVSFEVQAGGDLRPPRPQRLGQVHPAQVHRRHPAAQQSDASWPRGRLAALLELGAGFHPDLTGRENIYLNGSILGFSRIQIDRIFDDIVAFAELEEFIDQQVKHYSSGMYARLGFAVAINVEPEILLVDEVLAVGDESFQRKCIDRVRELQADGRTILLVSHAADLVRQLADRAAVLDHGRLVEVAEPGEAIRVLRETLERRGIAAPDLEAEPVTPAEPGPVLAAVEGTEWSGPPPESGEPVRTSGDKVVEITKVAWPSTPTPSAKFLLPNQPMRIRIDYFAPERIDRHLHGVRGPGPRRGHLRQRHPDHGAAHPRLRRRGRGVLRPAAGPAARRRVPDLGDRHHPHRRPGVRPPRRWRRLRGGAERTPSGLPGPGAHHRALLPRHRLLAVARRQPV